MKLEGNKTGLNDGFTVRDNFRLKWVIFSKYY